MSFDPTLYYQLTNKSLGAGQAWTLQQRADGTYKLTNDLRGTSLSLGTAGTADELVLGPGDDAGHQLSWLTVQVDLAVRDSCDFYAGAFQAASLTSASCCIIFSSFSLAAFAQPCHLGSSTGVLRA